MIEGGHIVVNEETIDDLGLRTTYLRAEALDELDSSRFADLSNNLLRLSRQPDARRWKRLHVMKAFSC